MLATVFQCISSPNNPPQCECPLMTLFPVCPRMCASTFFCQPERLVRYRIRPYSVVRKSQFSLKVQCVSGSLNIVQLHHMSSSCLPGRRRRRGCRRRPRRRGPSCRTPAGSDPCKEEQPHMTSTVLRPPCPQIQTTFLTKLSKNVSRSGIA